MLRSRVLLIAFLGVLLATHAAAQAVVNPRVVEFDPSPDHDALTPDNQPMVARYDLQFYLVGAAQPFQTANLGKPTPGATGTISVDFSTLLGSWPLANGEYVARVVAVGPTGTGESDPSNAFTYLNCTYAVTPTTASVADTGGTTPVTVVAPTGCTWTVSTSTAWVTTSATSGNGTATVTLTATANTGAERSGSVIVAGQTVLLTQSATCAFTVSPITGSLAASGGSGSITVSATSGTGCGWTASSSASWMTVTPASGSGSGTVSYTATANGTPAARTAAVTVAGQTVSVTQAGVSCSFSISPGSQAVAVTGGSGTFGVTAPAGCSWSATSNDSWITATSGGDGGAGTVSYSVAPNTGAARTGTITVAGQTFTITQAGCSYSLAATTGTIVAKGGSSSVGVVTTTGCAWTVSTGANWITLGTSGGNGSGAAAFTAAPNPATTPRTGLITVAGQSYTLTQEAARKPLAPGRVRVIGG